MGVTVIRDLFASDISRNIEEIIKDQHETARKILIVSPVKGGNVMKPSANSPSGSGLIAHQSLQVSRSTGQ